MTNDGRVDLGLSKFLDKDQLKDADSKQVQEEKFEI